MNKEDPQQLAKMDHPWKSEDSSIHIILVSDEQFINLAEHPDEAVEKIFPQDAAPISLREHCRKGAERGATKLMIAYDYFFGGSKRSLYPDTELFQKTLKKVHDVAKEYSIGLEPSIISPLELGVGYRAKTGESGRWMHYREGLRDPQTGAYSVMMWRHTRWCNNKGPTPVKLVGARAFAYHEDHIPNTSFFAVDPEAIVELDTPSLEPMPGAVVDPGELAGGVGNPDAMFAATRVRVWSKGGPSSGKLDRVLVVLLYETVEMDYFSPKAVTFLDELAQQYHDQGISLAGIYSDEMHIQQDWSYHNHFDNGQFTMRYVSPSFGKAFAAKYGEQYTDFARYMLYFACNQHDFLPTHEPKLPNQHVFGSSLHDIKTTLKFRKDYYHFLEKTVVDLMIRTREKLEKLNGHELDAFYHATWAESPTCDAITVGGVHNSWSPEEHQRRYDYTPEFLWSNTVHQASAACANYFLWNEFLTGGNNDFPEGGYADRNYYARAFACSLAALNRKPLASAGMWGMPQPVAERMLAVSEVFGAVGHPALRSVQDYAPRQIEVLFLYPQDLVALDERFGSWIVQYGYANYISAEKLVEYGHVTEDGFLAVKDARYKALCVLYEPFPEEGLIKLMRRFIEKGGSVVWSSIPGLSDEASHEIADLFGVRMSGTPDPLGLALPGRQVEFKGSLANLPSQIVLTDYVVDRIFPVTPMEGVESVAVMRTGLPMGTCCVGTRKAYPGGGQALYMGFRPRDDQTASTGIEARTWFEVLNALGAYPSSGVFHENDNPSVVSRTSDILACTFPNGAVALCPHYCLHAENWQGGYYRKDEDDRKALAENPVPDDHLELVNFHIAGQTVNYRGQHTVTWRHNVTRGLFAFSGTACTGITLDGRSYSWADQPVDIAWHPLYKEQQVSGFQPLYRVWCGSPAKVHIPLNLTDDGTLEVWLGSYKPGKIGKRKGSNVRVGYGESRVPFYVVDGQLVLDIDDELCGYWLYVVQRK